MANSGFNQGQTGNATEVGAGVVKLATQAQVDAGQADDGGVPLVVTPDKIPNSNLFLEAGEAVEKGHPIIVGTGTDASILVSFTDGTGGTTTTSLAVGTWIAQSFTVPVGFRITSLVLHFQMVQSQTITIRLRETPTGADLAVGSASFGSTGIPTFRAVGITPYEFIEGQTYWIVASSTSAAYAILGSVVDNYPDGNALLSTDGGATFNAHPSIADFQFRINGNRTRPGVAYLATIVTKTQFAGFAQQDAAKAAQVGIITLNYLKNLYDGNLGPLIVGQKYFFSATPGLLATSGTDANQLGVAPTTTDLIRLER